ncbi:hypothetical protein VTK73DRAFT_9661 [Phialemonium thermophilum]|uniref:RRM domain-containing protein n=1 Tax=Phialemonium thermophilum TaxID=223376 RepID=A0ABR3XJ07_9PEZI
MASESEPADISDTIVVGGNYSDDSDSDEGIADDASFDAYGEDDDQEEQKDAEPTTGTDDYAHTFDSPPSGGPVDSEETAPEAQGSEAQHSSPSRQVDDVSKTSESVNSDSAASESVRGQSPVTQALSSRSPPTQTEQHRQDGLDKDAASVPGHELPAQFHQVEQSGATAAPSVSSSPSHAPAVAAAAPPVPTATPAVIGDSSITPSVTSGQEHAPAAASTDDVSTIDIQRLVADITSRASPSPPAAELSTMLASAPVSATSLAQLPSSLPLPPPPSSASKSAGTSALTASPPNSLPPKPSAHLRQANPTNSRPEQGIGTIGTQQSQLASAHVFPTQPLPASPGGAQAVSSAPYLAAGAPGTNTATSASDSLLSLPPPPPTSFGGPSQAYVSAPSTRPNGDISSEGGHAPQELQTWESFLVDEKHYMTEAKWDRFPDGSRIFIGNLSSEMVSKREVFNLFHRFGRLAQVSLKSAYGFVQYHNVADAEAAMQHAQGAELGGRKIHLEYSRTQKRKDDRGRSPDRRAPRSGQKADRYDGREQARRGRDDYRPARGASPRRDDLYGRDRDHYSSFDRRSRGRSRSPQRYAGYDGDRYRRRSPSPQRRVPPVGDELDIPWRYGDQVPDVQLLLLQEVRRDFVSWVQQAFSQRGLKSDVMFLNPRFPRDAVLRRQVLEGVLGVIELDMQAQNVFKIPLQVFDRSAGINNVRYDQYQDLSPEVAAELVVRMKAQTASHHPARPAVPAYPPAQPAQALQYPGQPGTYPYAGTQVPPTTAAYGQTPTSIQDVAGLVGRLDNPTLQALLASLQSGQSGASQAAPVPGSAVQPVPSMPATSQGNSQIDLNALLGSLTGAAGAPAAAVPAGASAPPAFGGNLGAYSSVPPASNSMQSPPLTGSVPSGVPAPTGDTAQQVQNIMATLARFRQ